jgi:hypothetical protein
LAGIISTQLFRGQSDRAQAQWQDWLKNGKGKEYENADHNAVNRLLFVVPAGSAERGIR